jgi:predicted xylose isomerase-like sugar epimerase
MVFSVIKWKKKGVTIISINVLQAFEITLKK